MEYTDDAPKLVYNQINSHMPTSRQTLGNELSFINETQETKLDEKESEELLTLVKSP